MKKISPRAPKRRGPHLQQRRDAGSTRISARTLDLLRFGAEQTFVRFDTVGEWLDPDHAPAITEPLPTTPGTPRGWPPDTRHRMMAVSQLMKRLERLGLVQTIQPWADQPAWFRLTVRGLREIGLEWEEIPFPDAYEDLEARLRHDRYHASHNHLINQVRLLLARGGAGIPLHAWRGERILEAALPPRQSGVHRPHKADGIVRLEEAGSWQLQKVTGEILDTIEMQVGQVIAIEVECSQKNDGRLEKILPDLLEHHDFVWYFCLTNTIRDAVAQARVKALPTGDLRRRVRIMLLEDYLP